MKPVVALDIDGTLGNWHHEFRIFAEKWLGRTLPTYTGGPMNKWLGVSKATYREIKLCFRQSGLKRGMPAYAGAKDLTRSLRKAGAEVWLCTTRPFLRYDRLDPDTRAWTRRHGIQFDGLLSGDRKYLELVRQVGAESIVATLDDLPEMRAQAEKLGLPAYLIRRPWNRDHEDERVIRGLPLAEEYFLSLLREWKEERRG